MLEPVYIMAKRKAPVRYSLGMIGFSSTMCSSSVDTRSTRIGSNVRYRFARCGRHVDSESSLPAGRGQRTAHGGPAMGWGQRPPSGAALVLVCGGGTHRLILGSGRTIAPSR